MKNQAAILYLFLIIVLTALFRILPHAPNFTPVLAVSLFAGALMATRTWLSFLVPVAAMALSDVFLGWHSTLPTVYLAMAMAGVIGLWLGRSVNEQGALSLPKAAGSALASSVVFFTITNFAVWATSGMYPKTFSGLWTCYVMGLPFFHNTVLSTFMFGGLFFAAYRVFDKRFAKVTISV